MTDILRAKAVLNFALSLIPKGSNLKAPISIRNDNLTSEESTAKCRLYSIFILT